MKSTARQYDGLDSRTTTYIFSDNSSGAKTLIKYENDESLEIKEGIILDQQHSKNTSKNSSGRCDDGPYSCTTAHISSGNISSYKTLTEYKNDETLETKEEIIHDEEIVAGQESSKRYEAKSCTVDTIGADILPLKSKLLLCQKKKIQESEPERKCKCEKCGRIFTSKDSLQIHQKFVCYRTPKVRCEFCDKQFKWKSNMYRHVSLVHFETNSSTPKSRHKCDKCFRSYCSLSALNQHKRYKHTSVTPHFTCDICDRKYQSKDKLSCHIIFQHLEL